MKLNYKKNLTFKLCLTAFIAFAHGAVISFYNNFIGIVQGQLAASQLEDSSSNQILLLTLYQSHGAANAVFLVTALLLTVLVWTKK